MNRLTPVAVALLLGCAIIAASCEEATRSSAAGSEGRVVAQVRDRTVSFSAEVRDEAGRTRPIPPSPAPFVVVRDANGEQVYRGRFQFG